ncbi:hypothetical protein PR202_ga03572 [Eleusine coracana subsp. coracana]|uniref:Lysine-specific demethylase REF6 n=1 Tax=Eleusine coracana subsp. coracana TaxID=191504 RepID=A0AAV5BNS4_ELECO|nr:hypothetical protein PR202_ga03572 [Eleusine coracana subsp. coracana]
MSRPAVDLPEWLRNLPEAPEYHPTAAESFPRFPAPPFNATLGRLRSSFAANAAAAGDAAQGPTFPTRLQQVGLSARNRRAASRRVWESGERYTLEAFRAKARDFEFPRHAAPPKNATPLQLEALFWGACAAKPFNVEYGNDMPGSGFAPPEEMGDAARDVGETEWNMRLAPRARGSLLGAMGRDVAGVTTPMLYVAMLYSWFAWHVEDHELHSLNYLHFGQPKTWYGVPRDAMLAFEDAVRVHGYADDVNAINFRSFLDLSITLTGKSWKSNIFFRLQFFKWHREQQMRDCNTPALAFQTLNQKTTVLSPEVLLSAGVPCCRLVQNPGEFVITFPGAYHSGFSHGFNCGEATNIATPRWLQVAKEAAIRRASTNCGPMVSHYQLLYELALSLRPRDPKNLHDVPRSSRLRDKKKNEGHASRTDDNIINSITSAQVSDRCGKLYSSTHGGASALGLLASAYDSSDSDEEAPENISTCTENNDAADGFTNIQSSGTSVPQKSNVQLCREECEERTTPSLAKPAENKSMLMTQASRETNISHFAQLGEPPTSFEQWSAYLDLDDDPTASCVNASSDSTLSKGKGTTVPDALDMLKLKYNKDSCKMHVFCLEHALETWTQLQQIGGANIMILCHPEYPRAESAAKIIAEDFGMEHAWKDITFKEATDVEIGVVIKLALQDEDTEPTSSDWAVKMGINIYYSAKQSKSPLYSKQVPFNSIIYKAFGQENPDSLIDDEGQQSGTTKKKVAGWWCGKVWMSNQVHPLLALEPEEENHDKIYSKAMFSSTSHAKVKEPSTRSTRINRSISKRLSRPKEGGAVEKSRAKKKRCTTSDEATLHCSGISMISEADHDQLRNFDDYSEHDNANESEEIPSIKQHQQHELQNMNKRSSSRREKADKRNNFYELHDENGDIDCRLDIDSIINTSVSNWDNSPPPGFGVVKVESSVKLQSNKGKSSKCKTSGDLLNGNNKRQKMDRKASTKKQKNGKTNRQFRENHTEDLNLAQLRNGDESMEDSWDEIPKQKSNAVKVKSGSKIQTAKEKMSQCQPSDDLCSGDKEGISCDTRCNKGDEATIENWDEIPKEKLCDAKVKSSGKIQSGKKKGSKHQSSDGLRNGDKGAKYTCDIEGCDMSFSTQQDLSLHKRDICPVKGCKKKFFCHKYLLQHRKVHLDERPLTCSHPGCKKTFKWPWAKTEHMRVHTGERPYACTEPGCTQTFRFVSDFSRHKRKTGHSSDKKRKNST